MGKKAYVKPELISLGKASDWIKTDNTMGCDEKSREKEIDEILLKLDVCGIKERIKQLKESERKDK